MKKVANYLFLIFILLLISGCQGTSGSSTAVGTTQGQGCLYFISREATNEGVVRACMGAPPEPILAAERIQEYALAKKTGTIAIIKKTDSGQNEIWIQHPGKKSPELLLTCEPDRCESLAINPDGSYIYYSRIGKITGFFQVDVRTGDDVRITSVFADWVDISPEGSYVRVHEPESGLVRVLSLEKIEVVLSFPGDTDLIGTWNPDGTRFLMGERNVEGQLLISRYAEISVPEQARIELFTLPMGLEFFRPAYFTADSFFVVARSGVRNNSRVISIIDNNGIVQNSVTEPTEYDHSSIHWNEDNQLLAYQRYDISRSDSVPEIVVWDQESGTSLIIAENAVQPRWWD
jgi:dipeptidyl aminopeptidase/acylaminoacyl peptidase